MFTKLYSETLKPKSRLEDNTEMDVKEDLD
jgi:hypothetical protein